MSFGEFDQSIDVSVEIQPADWVGAFGGGDLTYPLLPAAPSSGETLLEMFGSESFATIGGNYPYWGLFAGGFPVGDYGRMPEAVQIGTVAVPVITQRVRFRGALELRLFGGSVTPTTAARVRVKAARSHELTFRAERLERFKPKQTTAQRVLGVLRDFVGINQ